MNDLTVELCPESGICSIIKKGGAKVDLIPGEVEILRAAQGDSEKIRTQIANVDYVFSTRLTDENTSVIAENI